MYPPPSAWTLEQSVAAYQRLTDMLTEDPTLGPDEEVIALGVLPLPQGGTVPHPQTLLERLVDAAIWADRREEEAENLRKRYQQRRDRYSERSKNIRATIAQLMEVLSVKAAEAELGAVSMVKEATHVVVTVEADKLDPKYQRRPPVEADKIALGRDLRAGATVAGAELSNPGYIPRITPF